MENQLCARDWLDYLEAIGPLIAALIACGLAWWQGRIQSKQHNLALLDKRLDLKAKFEDYTKNKLERCLSPKPNENELSETYDELTNIAGDAYLLYGKDISEKIMELAQLFEDLKTAIYYHNTKNQGGDLSLYKDLNYEPDISEVHAKATYKMNLLVAGMHLIMREGKIS